MAIESCRRRCNGKGIKGIGNEDDGGSISPYSQGYAYCHVCEYFFNTTAVRCECCNERLRHKAVNATKKKRRRASSTTKTYKFRID